MSATAKIWVALSDLEKAVKSVATDDITLREVRSVRASLFQAAALDQQLKRDLY